MITYPAIDIFEGKVCRLKRGDYAKMTVYGEDPVSVALDFKMAGATALHIVDLEGARSGQPVNFATVEKIVNETGLFVQVGGGIRTIETIEKYLGAGTHRVILGTAAVSAHYILSEAVSKYGDAVAVSADIKDGFIAIKGWTETTGQDVLAFCKTVEEIGVKTLICTDISKDGMQSGSNIELYRMLAEKTQIEIIASGGVTTHSELKILQDIGISGAIIGKALYEGDIDLTILFAQRDSQ